MFLVLGDCVAENLIAGGLFPQPPHPPFLLFLRMSCPPAMHGGLF